MASITPPPRINLLRFHGVFAPNCRLRARIVPPPVETSFQKRGIPNAATA
jgi:hypothetical protein